MTRGCSALFPLPAGRGSTDLRLEVANAFPSYCLSPHPLCTDTALFKLVSVAFLKSCNHRRRHSCCPGALLDGVCMVCPVVQFPIGSAQDPIARLPMHTSWVAGLRKSVSAWVAPFWDVVCGVGHNLHISAARVDSGLSKHEQMRRCPGTFWALVCCIAGLEGGLSVVCLARLIVTAATVEGCIFTVVPKCLLMVTVS